MKLDLTRDDISIALNFACALLGIGSLAMGRNMGQAGLVPGIITLIIMYAANAYAAVCLSKTLLKAPKSVTTYGDLGEHIAGKVGRYLVVFTQFGGCILIPIAFLVLGGGTIMPILFADIWPNGGNPNVYIPLMALVLLPAVLIRSLKEAAWAAVLGTLGAFFGDLFAIIDSMANSPYYANTAPKIEPVPIVSVFGSLFMAFAAAVVIPALQREHPRPERVSSIVVVVFSIVTVIYLLIGVQGYFQYGCVAPPNLLLSMSSRTWELLAMGFFFVHILLAYAVFLNPALFLFERFCFNMHQVEDNNHDPAEEPYKMLQMEQHKSIVSTLEYRLSGLDEPHTEAQIVYKPMTISERIKSYSLRTLVVSVQVFVAMLLQGCFDDLVDFVGSSTISGSCVIIPIYLYYKQFGLSLSKKERVLAVFLMVSMTVLSLYTTVRYFMTILDKASEYGLFQSPPRLPAAYAGPRDLDLSYCQANPSEL